MEHLHNCIEAIHACLILAAITGRIDYEGGHYIPGPPVCRMYKELEMSDILTSEQRRKQIGNDRYMFLS